MSEKIMAYIHSLKNKETGENVLGEVQILQHNNNNSVIAEYQGLKCTAIFNPFVNRYYVDDVYGKIDFIK